MTTPTTLSIDVTGNSALLAAARDTIAYRPGAEDELLARISQVLDNRGFTLHNPDQEMQQIVEENLESNNFLWKTIGGISLFMISLVSYVFGHSGGANDILARLPKDQADKIKENLRQEAEQALDDLI